MNLETLKADLLKARKEKNAVTSALLTTLLSDIQKKAKDELREVTNDDFLSTIKKFVKGVNQAIEDCAKVGRDSTQLKIELAILMEYLPKQLEAESLKGEIYKIIVGLEDQSAKAMGTVMKELKAKFDGQFDNKTASMLVKSMLK